MRTALLIIIVVAAVFEAAAAVRIRRRVSGLDKLQMSLEKREEAAREAMRRNGETARNLAAQKDEVLRAAEVRRDVGITVEYEVTEKDVASFAADKIPAVVKSRIANKLGHEILRILPGNISVSPSKETGRDVYTCGVSVNVPWE